MSDQITNRLGEIWAEVWARIHEQYLDKVTLDLSKGKFFTWLSFS